MNIIAVKRTMDPMNAVLDCLFENKGEVFISNKILEFIKKAHSYTMVPCGKYDAYTFHKRARGTNALFSFLVMAGEKENKVYGLECVAELGLMEKHCELVDAKTRERVYVTLEGEEDH